MNFTICLDSLSIADNSVGIRLPVRQSNAKSQPQIAGRVCIFASSAEHWNGNEVLSESLTMVSLFILLRPASTPLISPKGD